MPTEHTEYTEKDPILGTLISVSSVCSVGNPPAFVWFVYFVVIFRLLSDSSSSWR